VIILAVKRVNMTLDPEVFEEFRKYGERKGIKISTWVTQKMKEFVEEEKAIEELKNSKR
jgi:TRAP-type C4-dicarboxylate transport system substrate-binding protein